MSKVINPHIPAETADGRPVLLLAVRCPKSGNLLGWILSDSGAQPGRWLVTGEYADGHEQENSALDIQNLPGYQSRPLWFNIYEDGTTGYGYPTEETALKYRNRDSRLQCIDTIKKKIVWKSPQQ